MKLALLVLFFTTGFQSAIAAQSVNAIDGVAMDGFDVVAYFKIGEPRKGSPEYSLQYKDQTWQFSSPGNLADFKASPEIYEPKFNGWCAFAVSEGYSADVDFIDGWSILDGKLYLNWNASTRDQFLKEQKVRKNLADQRWPVVESGLKAGWLKVHRHSDYPQIGIKHPQQLEN
ncbi:MAG: YHS domain-containing (seleno)protein [Pseudomonadota bacterium]